MRPKSPLLARALPLVVPLLAIAVAACSDSPTAVSPEQAPRFVHNELPRPWALFDISNTGCTRQQDNRYVCRWSVPMIEDMYPDSRYFVSAGLNFGADYVCVNPKSAKAKPRAGGTVYNEQITAATYYTDLSQPITGQVTLTPVIPADRCRGGFIPQITTFYPLSSGLHSAVEWVEEQWGETYQFVSLLDETHTATGTVNQVMHRDGGELLWLSLAFRTGSSQGFNVHPDVVIVGGESNDVVVGASASYTYYDGNIIKIELH